MALTEYWVDPASGDNANPGTEASPFEELRYATSTVIASAQSAGDTVIINCVPSVFDGTEQYIRLDAADWTGGKLIVRSAASGTPFTVGATGVRLIWAVGACDCELEIQDCHATMPRILEWAGLTTPSAVGVALKIGSRCKFLHSSTTAEDCMNFDSDATESSLEIEPGAIINGWASLCFGAVLRSFLVDGLKFNALACAGDSSYIKADTVELKNSELLWPTLNNNLFQITSKGTLLEVTGNKVDMQSSNGATAFWVDAPDSGVTGVECLIADNDILSNTPSPALHVGNVVDAGLTRSVNDATRDQFSSCVIRDNDIVNLNNDGGCLRAMVGTDNAVVYGNYLRRAVLGSGTNVHVVYLYGDGIQFRHNYVQGEILAFGPNQKCFGNIGISEGNGILLGGTQGGSQAIGGGNNYTISGNILMTLGDAALNDYAYNGAYPTNIGVLAAEVHNNLYVPLTGSQGAVRLTAAGLYADTAAEVKNLWNESVVSGEGSVWGDAANENNDQYSRVESTAELLWFDQLHSASGVVFTRNDFEAIKSGPPPSLVAEINADATQTLHYKLAEADQVLEDDGGVQVLRTYERGTTTELVPAKTAKQTDGTDLTNPTTQRLAGYAQE